MPINDLQMRAIHVVCTSYGQFTQQMLHVLLKHKADPNIQDCHGRTALHFASSMGNEAALIYLVKKCKKTLEIDKKTFGGETALHKAVQNLKIDCFQILL